MLTSRHTCPSISHWPFEFGQHACPWTGMRWRSGPLPIWSTMMKLPPGSSSPSHTCMPVEPYHSLMPSPTLIATCTRQTQGSSTLSLCRFPGKLLITQIPNSRCEKSGSSYAHGCNTGMRPACIRTSGWNPAVTTSPTLVVKDGGKAGWFCL